MTLNEQIKNFYTVLGQNGKNALTELRHHFPNDYDLNEMTYDAAEDFISQNPTQNKALLIGVDIGKHIAMATRPKLLSAKFSEEIGYYAQRQIGHLPQEQLCVALLDAQLSVIGWETIFVGSLTHVQASPREIFQRALRANALGFMIVHNHPSGNLKPSDADVQFSQRLKLLGEQMTVPMLDSFIVTRDSYWSMSENAQLKSIV
ncbi:JAB domain-containing protein [uncultured Leuconostoc sp.]|uniref:JAB domain-containing protein n=1 Tax=uncultured Leuconostoc sp. TaxID=173262 RepID=UPI0025D69FE5|nr:JAB domain-containing protein [uncultured Leuconostoc sp.]